MNLGGRRSVQGGNRRDTSNPSSVVVFESVSGFEGTTLTGTRAGRGLGWDLFRRPWTYPTTTVDLSLVP